MTPRTTMATIKMPFALFVLALMLFDAADGLPMVGHDLLSSALSSRYASKIRTKRSFAL